MCTSTYLSIWMPVDTLNNAELSKQMRWVTVISCFHPRKYKIVDTMYNLNTNFICEKEQIPSQWEHPLEILFYDANLAHGESCL